MKQAVTRRQWRFLASSALLCATAGVAVDRMPIQRLAGDAEWLALTKERHDLAACDDIARDELRRTRGNPPRDSHVKKLDRLKTMLGPEWQCASYAAGRAILARTFAPLRGWPDILRVVENLEAESGIAIDRVEITTSARADERGFIRVAIELRLAA